MTENSIPENVPENTPETTRPETTAPIVSIPVKPDKTERREIRKMYSRVGAAFLIFLLLSSVIPLIFLDPLFTFIFGAGTDAYENAYDAAQFLVPIVSEIIFILIAGKLTGIKLRPLFSRDGFNTKTIFKTYAVSQGYSFIISAVAAVLVAVMLKRGAAEEAVTAYLSMSDTNGLVMQLILAVYGIIIAPVLEEIIYRGIILQSLSKYNRVFAIVVSALLFAFIHGNIQQVFGAVIFGIVFGAVALRCNSILPTIFAHMFVNIVTLIVQNFSIAAELVGQNGSFGNMMMISLFTVLLYGVMIGILIMAIVITVKNRRRFIEFFTPATPLGKARALPVFITSIPWVICFVYQIFFVFVLPFVL
jgi:membrane protease YdiL (CAAX protease family)